MCCKITFRKKQGRKKENGDEIYSPQGTSKTESVRNLAVLRYLTLKAGLLNQFL